MKNKKRIIISLGGSIVVPEADKINTDFLKKFRKMILKFIRKNYEFIIIVGGGKVCRLYQNAASEIGKVSYEDKDWIGIHATRLNAHLLRTIFEKEACPIVLDDPHKKLDKSFSSKPIIIASGWKPGWSTDYVAVLLAKRFKVEEMLNASNISFVYDKDVKKYKDALPIKKISWGDYRKLISSKWIPGMGSPVDPIAAKTAQKIKLRVVVFKGTDLKNFERILSGKKFKGSVIES